MFLFKMSKKSVIILIVIAIPVYLSGCFTLKPKQKVLELNGMKIQEEQKVYALSLNDQIYAHMLSPTIEGNGAPAVNITKEDDWFYVELEWDIKEEVAQDELSIPIILDFDPDFWWSPHLTPEDGYVIDQHVFRSPAVIAQKESLTLVLVPDLDLVGQIPDNNWFMDYDARTNRMWVGMSHTKIPVHVLFQKEPGMKIPPGKLKLGFFLAMYNDSGEVRNPWARVTEFLWNKWAKPLYESGEPGRVPLDRYVEHTYNWAFDSWGDVVWQEFEIDGRKVGAPQFIVNYSQSPNFPEPDKWHQREMLSIWNQAWFSSLRSASGVYRYARRTQDKELMEKARLTRELALAAPMKDGIFPSVIRTDNFKVEIDGKTYNRPEGWETAYWTNSNRSPRNFGINGDWYHVLDCSWTCLLMLRWHQELEPDEHLIDYAETYADKLLAIQDEEGFFPGWLHPDTLTSGTVMNQTPESSMSVTFLLTLAEITGDDKYASAALKAMDAVIDKIIPKGQWEDYETYWSCCRWGRDDYVGRKIERNEMFKQNTLSMFWTAEALLACYKYTGDKRYLDWGRRTLDELSMAQQVWQPPFIYVPALGGFGVMNADGEWTDSRETLFAELFMDYYKATGDSKLFERGVAALKSGFIMMYCPENPRAKVQWEKRYPWFGPEDYGFTIENYGHGGRTSPEGGGIGPFTIYDWGNGAASEARNRIYDHYGDVYIDRTRGQAFGIDSIGVKKVDGGWELTDLANVPRNVRIVYDDGESEIVRFEDFIMLEMN